MKILFILIKFVVLNVTNESTDGTLALITSKHIYLFGVEIHLLLNIVFLIFIILAAIAIGFLIYYIKTKKAIIKRSDELLENEKKYKIITENTVECIWVLDLKNNRFTYMSPSIFQLRGLTVSEALNEKLEDSLTPESLARTKHIIEEALKKSIEAGYELPENYIGEFQQYHKNGSLLDIEISVKYVWNKKTNFFDVVGVSRDITDRKKLYAQNIYHRNLLEVSLDPLVTIGRDGKITDVNKATIDATGYDRDKLIGTDFSTYFTDPDKARAGYEKVFLDGKVKDYILELKHKNGNTMIVAYNASVYKDQNDEVVGVFAAARDITDKTKLQNELEKHKNNLEELVKIRTTELENINVKLMQAINKAEKANKAKGDFLSNMSHELRTPLNGILGFTDILLEMESDIDKKDYLNTIMQSGKHLLEIINDILDVSKIESGVVKVDIGEFELDKILKFVSLNFEIAFKNKKNEFILKNKTSSNLFCADEQKIKQILINLIGNANKFTENGEIVLDVEEKIEKNDTILVFKIEDSGIGIDKHKIEHLYDAFYQGEDHLTKKFGGTGLGLTIVKKLVDMMEGEIEVESNIGTGTSFTIKIPVTKRSASGEIDNKNQTTSSNLDLSAYKLLIAEDTKTNLKLIEFFLSEVKIKYDIAKDGLEVLECLKKNRYDLILMDIQMPNLNGLDATKIIRDMKDKTVANIPIVAVSAYALKEEIERAYSYGVSDYLPKPFSKIELIDKLKKWL